MIYYDKCDSVTDGWLILIIYDSQTKQKKKKIYVSLRTKQKFKPMNFNGRKISYSTKNILN